MTASERANPHNTVVPPKPEAFYLISLNAVQRDALAAFCLDQGQPPEGMFFATWKSIKMGMALQVEAADLGLLADIDNRLIDLLYQLENPS